MTSLFLLISVSLALHCNCQADLIGDICSKSTNPSLCNNSLRSDPRSSGADLQKLAQIAIDKAESATNATLKVANVLIINGPNKQKAQTCAEMCIVAIDFLNQCRYLLSVGTKRDIADLRTKASSALIDINTCDSVFGGSEPPQLKQPTLQAQDLVNVLSVIANRL